MMLLKYLAQYLVQSKHFKILFLSYTILTGEGNGTPLQYSCLEGPRGGGAWWAAISGVAQNWT